MEKWGSQLGCFIFPSVSDPFPSLFLYPGTLFGFISDSGSDRKWGTLRALLKGFLGYIIESSPSPQEKNRVSLMAITTVELSSTGIKVAKVGHGLMMMTSVPSHHSDHHWRVPVVGRTQLFLKSNVSSPSRLVLILPVQGRRLFWTAVSDMLNIMTSFLLQKYPLFSGILWV